MFEDDKSDTSTELESDGSDAKSPRKSTIGSSDSSLEKDVVSSKGKSPEVGKASKIYYVIGTPITQPKCDLPDEHVRWLQETFDSKEVGQESDQFDIFQAVLDQCDIPSLCASELLDFMIDFIMK